MGKGLKKMRLLTQRWWMRPDGKSAGHGTGTRGCRCRSVGDRTDFDKTRVRSSVAGRRCGPPWLPPTWRYTGICLYSRLSRRIIIYLRFGWNYVVNIVLTRVVPITMKMCPLNLYNNIIIVYNKRVDEDKINY